MSAEDRDTLTEAMSHGDAVAAGRAATGSR